MTGSLQPDLVHERLVKRPVYAALFVLLAAWSLYLRIRHLSARFDVPRHLIIDPGFYGSAGRILDVLIYISFVVVMFGLFSSTRDRVEKVGIIGCFANAILNPFRMLLPSHTAAIWWVELGFVLMFLLASVAAFLRLSRHDSISEDAPQGE